MKPLRTSRLILAIVIACSSTLLGADKESELSKTIRQGFGLDSNGNIEIINKYGQVIVNAWAEDSVYVEVKVTAYGRTDEAVEKSINRVEFDFNQIGDYLTLETVLDRESGSFKEFLNTVGDASKSIISKNKLIIDYQVYVPAKANLEIDNKFGNVYLEEVQGRLKLNLSQGNLKAEEITGPARMDLSFGNAHIKLLDNGDLTLKAAEIDIDDAGSLSVTSSSSEMHITKVNDIKLDSRNDQIEILEASSIEGLGRFTNIDNGFLRNSLSLSMDYGELNLYRVEENFKFLTIQGKSTDVLLKFETESYFDVDIVTELDNLIYPEAPMDTQTEYLDEKDKTVRVTGTMGPKRLSKSTLSLNSTGDVRIGFLQIRTQTKREP